MTCECGCGTPTRVAPWSDRNKGWVKGRPLRFARGHNNRGRTGEAHAGWKGGRHINDQGYVLVYVPEHPRAAPNGYVREHLLVAERALGAPLPDGAVVHHVDSNRTNNDPRNLVICQDEPYHNLLHQRTRAMQACGNANYRACHYCKQYDAPDNLTLPKRAGGSAYHRACAAANSRHRRNVA